MITRENIVATARTWIGTRFHHQGRLKMNGLHFGGCDCLGLLIGVAKELGLPSLKNKAKDYIADFDEFEYRRIPDAAKLRAKLEDLLYPVEKGQINIGDVLLFKFGANPQHLGIVSDHPAGRGIIHAFRDAGKVVEHRLDGYWQDKIFAAFSFFPTPSFPEFCEAKL